jgi:alpha-tubulin suppressor-like RCC1 family protein
MKQLSAGGTHNCAIDAGGATYCWGSHELGQLGAAYGITTCPGYAELCSEQPVRVLAPSLASISAGGAHTCAIDAAGAAYCWGYGAHGRLGTLRSENEAVPVNVEGDVRFRAIAAGGTFTCGISLEGAAYCWGYNHLGQLGDGTTLQRAQPTRVITDEVFATITVGTAHACALTPQGAAFCWGANGQGGLGTGEALAECGSYGCDMTPRPVIGGHVFSAINAGSSFVCGVTGKGVLCWGRNDDRQTGTGRTSPVITEPTVLRGTTLRSVDAGFSHACGLRGDGAAYCWGTNWHGVLGNGDYGDRSGVPVPVVAP